VSCASTDWTAAALGFELGAISVIGDLSVGDAALLTRL
jgi:hypothetical protein